MADTEIDGWITALSQALQIDSTVVDVQALLDVARDAAHGVTRPAAPLSTFLIGFAAASNGGGPEAVAQACDVAAELAAQWPSQDGPVT